MAAQDEIGLLDPVSPAALPADGEPEVDAEPEVDGEPEIDGEPGGGGVHILLIVENVALSVDQRVRKQVPSLLAAGHHVTVITRRAPGNAAWRERPGLTVLEYPAPPESEGLRGYLVEYGQAFCVAAVLAVRAHRLRPVDVLHLCQPPDVYFPIAWWLRRTGAAVVVDQRDLMPELFAARYGEHPRVRRVLQWLERRTQRAADLAIGVNHYLETRLRDAGARDVAVVRNGPQTDRVAAARPDPALRAGADHLCCWAGKMGRQDRVDLLLEAVRYFVHVLGRRDTRFVLLGDGECLAELRARATALDLDEWVSFPGWLSEDGLFTHLATADVGLDASLQIEVSPVKVMEYMAFGMPVVAFDLPETTALLHGAGVAVAPGDVAGLADALSALLDDPERARTLGRAGADRIAGELGWEHQAAVYLAAIDRVAPRRAAPTSRRTPRRNADSPGTE